MKQSWEHATVEWLWDKNRIRWNLPGGVENKADGSYNEVVQILTDLGREGWEAVTCCASANWLFWTLKRPAN